MLVQSNNSFDNITVCSRLKNALTELVKINGEYLRNIRSLTKFYGRDTNGKICNDLYLNNLSDYANTLADVSQVIERLNKSLQITDDELIQYFTNNDINKRVEIFHCNVEEIYEALKPIRRNHTRFVRLLAKILIPLRSRPECRIIMRQIIILRRMLNANIRLIEELLHNVDLLADPSYISRPVSMQKTRSVKRKSKRKTYKRTLLTPIPEDPNEDVDSPTQSIKKHLLKPLTYSHF
jgi:hypothetical protein